MRRFRPAPLSRLALLEGDQKSDRLFTDLGLRDDLQAGRFLGRNALLVRVAALQHTQAVRAVEGNSAERVALR